MGLDTVEIVMELEDHFDVRLPDGQCTQVATVGDLAALVLSHLRPVAMPCPTHQTFNQIRRVMMSSLNLSRSQIRPRVSLRELFPLSRRRSMWAQLRECNPAFPAFPALQGSHNVDYLCLWATALAIFVAPLVMAVSLLNLPINLSSKWDGALVAAVGVMTFAVVLMGSRIANLLAFSFPGEAITIGELARNLAPIQLPATQSVAEQDRRDAVLLQVRQIVAREMCLPLDRVQADSNIFSDLGAS